MLRFANATMQSESIFLYMTLTGLLLVPVALYMTDFGKPINWGPSGPWLAAPIQLLNSIGALTMVYAFRHGKVIIVSPMINALAPVITIVLSLVLYRVVPHRVVVAGMALAAVAFYLMARGARDSPARPRSVTGSGPASSSPWRRRPSAPG